MSQPVRAQAQAEAAERTAQNLLPEFAEQQPEKPRAASVREQMMGAPVG